MTVFVSLLRGVNVGGNHKVPMSELKELYASLGLQDICSYIQSGNVVFKSEDTDEAQLRKRIEDSIEKKFGFHSDVFIRTSAELQEIIERNPFQGQQNKESKWLVVTFLAARPDDRAQETLLKTHKGPEELFFTNKELYIYFPEGMGRSKLTQALLDKTLKTSGTARNLNTVLKLLELTLR